MVYYIRFLKTPRIQKQKAGSTTTSALICLTTDLGDDFLAEDVDLLVTLNHAQSGKILYQEPLKWTAGKRELSISLGPLPAQFAQNTLVMGVTAINFQDPRATPSSDSLVDQQSMPLVMSGWSTAFGGSQPSIAEKLIERRFTLKNKQKLSIWEETGNSIARHIWDAAIASIIYLQQVISGDSLAPVTSLLQSSLRAERSNPLRVIELGSGCGIVGIALGEMLPQCSVLLTDLPELEEIVAHNIDGAKPARSSKIDYRPLDWEEELPDNLCGGSIDLMLISDCTYNADSLPILVSVLDRLVKMSPDAIILVALKRRHESENVFFDLMQSAGLHVLHLDYLQLPSQHDQVDEIQLYCYGREGRHPAQSIEKPTSAI